MSVVNVKNIYENIAELITETGLERTSNGSYYIYFTDIAKAFEVSVEWVKEHTADIEECFDWDIVAECDIDDEAFGMYFYGNACCEECGCQASSSCCCCEVAHPEEWDEIKDEEEDIEIKPTRDINEAIKNYNLHKIFTGSLSQVPNDRYTRSKHCFDIDKLGKDLTKENFVMVFNHFEQRYACWTVWETPYMNFERIKEIYMKEKDRKLWDSRQLYYDDGDEVIIIVI